ncbi:MAG: amidohydrolase [Alicyclobacillus sp.]|nr:amidohydrolase [Alicyclobacillus sp.]
MRRLSRLFFGGDIVTMGAQPTVEAVAVRGTEIVWVGSLDACKAVLSGEKYEEINLEGHTLMPGFVDPHLHLMMLGMCRTWVDLAYPRVKSIDDIVQLLSEHAKRVPEGGIIRGFGFDQRTLAERRYPTADDLDRIARDRPVQIMHISGHSNVVNHFFLEMMGLTANTPDPVGGMIGRDENGVPNGQLYDSANDFLTMKSGIVIGRHGPNIHMPDTPENLQNLIRVGQREALAAGITTINDPQVTSQEMASFLTAKKSGLLKLRVIMSFSSAYLNDLIGLGFFSGFGDDNLAIGSIKFYADGSLNAGTAFLSSEYRDSKRTKGYLFHDPAEFNRMFIMAHQYGFQTLTHAQGDGAIQLVIDAVRAAQSQYPKYDIRHRIEHCGLPTWNQLRDIADLRIWPVPQPQHVYQFGEGVIRAVGDHGKNYSPYGWFKLHNIPIVLSSDAPVAPPNPLLAIYAAVTRCTLQGNVIGPEHRIELTDALRGYTIEAAKAIHREHLVGSIECDKEADFVVLSKNPYQVPIEEIKNIDVLSTWIAGEQVFTRGEVL